MVNQAKLKRTLII